MLSWRRSYAQPPAERLHVLAAAAQATKAKRAQLGTPEMHAALGTAKAAKVAARHLREGGQKPKEASRAALTAVGAPARKQTQKTAGGSKRKAGDTEDEPDAKVARGTRVYAGGGHSGTLRPVRTGPSKLQKARAQRGGRGRAQFKSKAKHKRR
jgi:hypothetical protein